MNYAHASPTTTTSSLNNNGVTNFFSNGNDFFGFIRKCTFRSRNTRHARFFHGIFCANFVAHEANRFWTGTYKYKTTLLNALSKICILRQKAIARVNGLCICNFCSANDSWDI